MKIVEKEEKLDNNKNLVYSKFHKLKKVKLS